MKAKKLAFPDLPPDPGMSETESIVFDVFRDYPNGIFTAADIVLVTGIPIHYILSWLRRGYHIERVSQGRYRLDPRAVDPSFESQSILVKLSREGFIVRGQRGKLEVAE